MPTNRVQIPPPTLSSYIPFMKSDNSHGRSSSGGILGWLGARFHSLKNRNNRSAAGSYEPSAGRRGNFGPLDPDEAWDSRVHDEYDEDLETGYRGAGAGNRDIGGGGGYEMNLPQGREERGRPGRNPFEDDVAVEGTRNPFGDDAAVSNNAIRGVSPRPMEGRGRPRVSEDGDRRSAFREDV